MDFLKLPMYRLGATTMGTEVNKPRFSLGGVHSPAAAPTGPRIHLSGQHLSAPYSAMIEHKQIHHLSLEGGKEARNDHLPIEGKSPSKKGS